jgi:hypothetical protein
MAAGTQHLQPTHRAYSTPSEGGGTRMCLGLATPTKTAGASTLNSMRFRRTETSPVGQLPNGARQRRAASCERRDKSRTHLDAESDPFRRSRKHRAASWGGSFV